MALSVVAQAESAEAWSEVSARLRRAIAPLDARWLETVDPNAKHVEAWIEVGPADPVGVMFKEGLLTVQARTAPWGPGYHQRVVALVDALGEQFPGGWLRVEDPTDYFQQRQPDELARIFLRYAYSLWSVDDRSPSALLNGVSVGLAAREGPVEVPDGLVATPTGFKSRGWIEATCAGLKAALAGLPGAPLPREARQAFLWWFSEPDAFDWIQLGRAVCTSDVIWRPLLGEDSPGQVETRERAIACFESALGLDSTAPVPLEELRRLYELVGRVEDAERVAARAQEQPHEPFQGGYREGWIRYPLGARWNLQLPGWLRAACDAADGHDVFWDDRMTVHVSVTALRRSSDYSAEREANHHLEQLSPEARSRARVELIDNGKVQGYALLTPYRNGDEATLVQGEVGRNGDRVTFTVVVRAPEACPLALRLGRSLIPT